MLLDHVGEILVLGPRATVDDSAVNPYDADHGQARDTVLGGYLLAFEEQLVRAALLVHRGDGVARLPRINAEDDYTLILIFPVQLLHARHDLGTRAEIGRASCRERV